MSSIENQSILVPASQYNLSSDKRILIPFEQSGKIGYMNQSAEIVINPTYDIARGEFYTQNDLVEVGVMKHRLLGGKIYSKMAYGIIDCCGNYILELDYHRLIFSDDGQFVAAQPYENTSARIVYSRKGDIVIAKGEYDWIDGFWKGFARVKRNGKFGVIDTKNQIVLPIEYNNIWNFYGKDYDTIIIEKDKISSHISFDSLNRISNPNMVPIIEDPDFCDRWIDDYAEPQTYGEYEESYVQDVLGWSDQMINDAFDGDPDAYWNID